MYTILRFDNIILYKKIMKKLIKYNKLLIVILDPNIKYNKILLNGTIQNLLKIFDILKAAYGAKKFYIDIKTKEQDLTKRKAATKLFVDLLDEVSAKFDNLSFNVNKGEIKYYSLFIDAFKDFIEKDILEKIDKKDKINLNKINLYDMNQALFPFVSTMYSSYIALNLKKEGDIKEIEKFKRVMIIKYKALLSMLYNNDLIKYLDIRSIHALKFAIDGLEKQGVIDKVKDKIFFEVKEIIENIEKNLEQGLKEDIPDKKIKQQYKQQY